MRRELERVKAEREFYCVTELEEHNRLVTDAATNIPCGGRSCFATRDARRRRRAEAQVRHGKLDVMPRPRLNPRRKR
jgi:hypothetical protein